MGLFAKSRKSCLYLPKEFSTEVSQEGISARRVRSAARAIGAGHGSAVRSPAGSHGSSRRYDGSLRLSRDRRGAGCQMPRIVGPSRRSECHGRGTSGLAKREVRHQRVPLPHGAGPVLHASAPVHHVIGSLPCASNRLRHASNPVPHHEGRSQPLPYQCTSSRYHCPARRYQRDPRPYRFKVKQLRPATCTTHCRTRV